MNDIDRLNKRIDDLEKEVDAIKKAYTWWQYIPPQPYCIPYWNVFEEWDKVSYIGGFDV